MNCIHLITLCATFSNSTALDLTMSAVWLAVLTISSIISTFTLFHCTLRSVGRNLIAVVMISRLTWIIVGMFRYIFSWRCSCRFMPKIGVRVLFRGKFGGFFSCCARFWVVSTQSIACGVSFWLCSTVGSTVCGLLTDSRIWSIFPHWPTSFSRFPGPFARFSSLVGFFIPNSFFISISLTTG